jgi:hypothetical protein
MTESEKRQQKAELLLEYQEAEDNLAHLREQAKSIHDRLEKLTQWMNDYCPSSYPRQQVEVARRHAQIISDPQIEVTLDFQKILALVKEVQEGEAKLSEMKQRKNALGLR